GTRLGTIVAAQNRDYSGLDCPQAGGTRAFPRHWLIDEKGAREERMTAPDRQKQDEESRHPGSYHDDSGRAGDDSGGSHPYDSSDLDKVPRPADDDPPYRSWWVI